MPEYQNKDIIGGIITTSIDVIGRRTSEGYAIVMISNIINELKQKYDLLKYVNIKRTNYISSSDNVIINPDINYLKINELGNIINDFLLKIVNLMGKQTGYYFVKEIKDELPFDYEKTLRDLDVDFNNLQYEYLWEQNKRNTQEINNSELIYFIFQNIFKILEKEKGKRFAFLTINEQLIRFRTEFDLLRYVKINDINFLQGVETISVMTDINSIETTKVGYALQNIIQEINNSIELKEGFNFVKKLKESLNSQHVFKLEEMGVNFNVISLNHKSVMKHVLEVLVDLLSNYSSKSYAMLIINNTINEIDSQYHLSRYIQIKTEDFTEENYPISIKSDINSVGYIELGRGIQKVIEKITEKIGEEAGENFIDNFKTKLGEAYLAKLEKMGVNFHLIQLRKNLLF